MGSRCPGGDHLGSWAQGICQVRHEADKEEEEDEREIHLGSFCACRDGFGVAGVVRGRDG